MNDGAVLIDTGGRDLLDRAIEAHYEDIRNALRRRGAEQSQATEIVHDLYVQLSGKPERLQGKTFLRAFLIRAAVNLRIDRLRRSAFESRLFAALDERAHAIPGPARAEENRLDMPRRVEALRQAIFSLPTQCRNVFIAYRIADMSKDEIADALGVKRRMVDRHLRKAMLHCLEKMEEFDGE